MKITAALSNTMLRMLAAKGHRRLLRCCDHPETEQQKVLLQILKKNSSCEFGKIHRFESISSVKEFQENVPVSTYDDYLPFIGSIRQGYEKVLCTGQVNYFALTSGSGAASKLIPYTRSLKNDFNRAVYPWLFDLFSSFPALQYGTQFWIISPSTETGMYPDSKVPVGFENDRNYFGILGKMLLRPVMCLPDFINRISDSSNYFYLLSYCLLRDKHLRLISVWNPGLLLPVVNCIASNYRKLCEDIIHGTIRLPEPGIASDNTIVSSIASPMPVRGKMLASLREWHPSHTAQIWPRLQLISCWTDAWAGIFLDDIRKMFPGIKIQGKGLLATEGVVSIPLTRLDFPLLTIQSHFYEFRNLSDDTICLAHELVRDEKYEVILTTSGGLYRYRLMDIVRVRGHFKNAPLLEFTGRTDIVSDVCGEKLHEDFVAGVLQKIAEKFLTGNSYMYLAPCKGAQAFFYTLFIGMGDSDKHPDYETMINELDNLLKQNYHYKHCRNMKQLDRPGLKILDAENSLKSQMSRHGKQISGTRKFPYLQTSLADPDELNGISY